MDSLPADVKCALEYYISYYPLNHSYNNNELNYIFRCTTFDLHLILGPEYKGPCDRASLLFAILTGYQAPRPNIEDYIDRYNEIKNVDPKLICELAEYCQIKHISPYMTIILNNIIITSTNYLGSFNTIS